MKGKINLHYPPKKNYGVGWVTVLVVETVDLRPSRFLEALVIVRQSQLTTISNKRGYISEFK